jgi:hypothetical protein
MRGRVGWREGCLKKDLKGRVRFVRSNEQNSGDSLADDRAPCFGDVLYYIHLGAHRSSNRVLDEETIWLEKRESSRDMNQIVKCVKMKR